MGSTSFRSFQEIDDGIKMFFPENYNVRSQDIPIALHDAGQFYWVRSEAWLNKYKIFSCHSSIVIIPNWRVRDIDTEDDWEQAQIMWKVWQEFKDRK